MKNIISKHKHSKHQLFSTLNYSLHLNKFKQFKLKCTYHKRACQEKDLEALIGGFIFGNGRLRVYPKHALFAVALDVDRMPVIVVKWVGCNFFQGLRSVTYVIGELDGVSP